MIKDKSEIEERGKRVQFIRKELLGLSRSDFCKNFSLSPQSLKAWELSWGGGLNEDRARDLTCHLKKLGIHTTVPWLMHGIGNPPSPLTNEVYISEEEEEHIAKELLLFRELSGAVDTIIDDDCMAPLLYAGDYIGGVIVSEPKLAIDQICIVTDSNGKTFVRTLKAGDKINFYHLQSFNEDNRSSVEIRNIPIKTAAPVLWIRRRKRHKPSHLDPW